MQNAVEGLFLRRDFKPHLLDPAYEAGMIVFNIYDRVIEWEL